MYDFFKQIAQKSYCLSDGVCSIDPSVNSLYELLLSEAREASSYIVKLNEFKIAPYEKNNFLIEILSIHLINTSFCEADYLNILKKLNKFKIEIKEQYIKYCNEKRLPCEIFNNNFNLENIKTISELIKFSEENIINRKKGCESSKLRLFELIATFTRLCAINIVKLKKVSPSSNEFDYEIIRFFALTNAYSIRNEKIIRRIKEFSNTAFKIRKKLLSALEEKYGKIENTIINTRPSKGHCILVSGEDFDELELILSTVSSLKENINVYTHGDLFLTHFYPYFKNNIFLKGHWGKNDVEYDFSTFPGAIFLTQNFNQKIDNLYKGELFSSKLISFKKVSSIKNGNYSPLTDSAIKLTGFESDENKEDNKTYEIEYNDDYINKIIEKVQGNELVIIAGNKEIKTEEKYKDKTIINITFPYSIEVLNNIIEKCLQKNIKVTLFFMQCNKISLENLLILIDKNINITIANCSYVLINPHVTECLRKDFNISII